MATIRNRGEYQWEAQIRRKGYPAQRKTFESKSDAQAWARMIESEIDRGIFVSRVEAERTAFHQLIDRYISEIAPKHKGAYSEIKRLEALKRHPLATRIVATLTSSDFALISQLNLGRVSCSAFYWTDSKLSSQTGSHEWHYDIKKLVSGR